MSDWNTSVVFGMGRERGAAVSGFHRNGGKGVFSGVVYRGDSRAPTVLIGTGVFKRGFQLHAPNVQVSGRMTANEAQVNEKAGTTRGVVSATTSVKMAAYWAVHNNVQEGWVYCMYIENEEWAAEASMNLMGTEGRGAADTQKEIMFLSLPSNRIYAARRVKRLGGRGPKQTYLVGKLVPNPDYSGTNPYGVAFKDEDFKIFVDGGQQVLCE